MDAPKDTYKGQFKKAIMGEGLGGGWFTRVFLKYCGKEGSRDF